MRNVIFTSAGAGSGKTYSIVTRIVDYIKEGVCHADEIILTTFTVAAAGELKEKVRKALYENNLFEEAIRLDNAAIGTIHSISYQLIARYWYLLEISADVRLIADDSVDFYKSQSISQLPAADDLKMFKKVRDAFSITKKNDNGGATNNPDTHFWKKDLQHIIDKIESFDISSDMLQKSEEMSLEILRDLLGADDTLPESLPDHKAVIIAVKSLINNYVEENGENNKSVSFRNSLEEFINEVDKANPSLLAFRNLAKKIKKEAKSRWIVTNCSDELDLIYRQPNAVVFSQPVYDIISSYIKTIFNLVKKWKKEYECFKKERRLLDFNDTQRLFGDLIAKKEIKEELRSRYKVVFVDEFQDCSPQQIKFFTRLSHILDRNIWVGDIKQAIYGFRGTDTEEVKNVIDKIACGEENGNSLERLKYSWRSNSSIVNLVNDVFVAAFSDLNEDLIRLRLPEEEKKYDRPAEKDLLHLHINGRIKDDIYKGFAEEIEKICKEENLEYRDIAILCRDKYDIKVFVDAFKEKGIPYRKVDENPDKEINDTLELLNAIVSAAASDYNSFSKALLLYYTEPGQTASRIISERLKFLADKEHEKDNLNDASVLKHIEKMRNTVGNQSVASAVDTLLTELDAVDLLRRLDPQADAYRIVNDYAESAVRYEDICNELSLGCSLEGFVDWIGSKGIRESGNEDGITVSTYHKAKGLEWKCVVLGSLHKKPVERDKVFFGVNIHKDGETKKVVLMPDFISSMETDTLVDRIEKSEVYEQLKKAVTEESKRLLYVGMTRPKEFLITFTARSVKTNNDTIWPDTVTGVEMNASGCKEDEFNWFGHTFQNRVVTYVPEATAEEPIDDTEKIKVLEGGKSATEFIPRDVAPSHEPPLQGLTGVEQACEFSDRLQVVGDRNDDSVLGNCIHQLLCVYRDDPGFNEIVAKIAGDYGVVISPDDFMTQARAFYACLRDTYGESSGIEREVPFRFRRDNGQIVKGEIDLIYRTAEGDVLIDYKTCLRPVVEISDENSNFYAGKYSGQLALYEEAIRLAGRKLRDSLICYFNLGVCVRCL